MCSWHNQTLWLTWVMPLHISLQGNQAEHTPRPITSASEVVTTQAAGGTTATGGATHTATGSGDPHHPKGILTPKGKKTSKHTVMFAGKLIIYMFLHTWTVITTLSDLFLYITLQVWANQTWIGLLEFTINNWMSQIDTVDMIFFIFYIQISLLQLVHQENYLT